MVAEATQSLRLHMKHCILRSAIARLPHSTSAHTYRLQIVKEQVKRFPLQQKTAILTTSNSTVKWLSFAASPRLLPLAKTINLTRFRARLQGAFLRCDPAGKPLCPRCSGSVWKGSHLTPSGPAWQVLCSTAAGPAIPREARKDAHLTRPARFWQAVFCSACSRIL